jgi:hypothetical protein
MYLWVCGWIRRIFIIIGTPWESEELMSAKTVTRYLDRTEDAYGSFSQSKAPTSGLLTFWRLLDKYSVVFVADVSSLPSTGLTSTRFPFDGLVFNALNYFLTRSILGKRDPFQAKRWFKQRYRDWTVNGHVYIGEIHIDIRATPMQSRAKEARAQQVKMPYSTAYLSRGPREYFFNSAFKGTGKLLSSYRWRPGPSCQPVISLPLDQV